MAEAWFKYREWAYDVEVDVQEDCKKIFHTARRGVEERSIDHSPYEAISPLAFRAHVICGFPARSGRSSWRNESILAYAKACGHNVEV